MENRTFKDLVKSCRSFRGYDESRKVTREELEDMVDCARCTASSVNLQPLKYRLVYDEATVRQLQHLVKWASMLPDAKLPHPGHGPAAFIVICQDTDVSNSIPRFQKDVGIAAQTILLAAAEKGLGGCMLGSYNPAETVKLLNLAPNLAPVLVVAIGKPDETVVLREIDEGEPTKYYRDGNDVHYVPKRKLKDVLI